MNFKVAVIVLCLCVLVCHAAPAKKSSKSTKVKKGGLNKKFNPTWKNCISKPIKDVVLCNSTVKYPTKALKRLLRAKNVTAVGMSVIEPASDDVIGVKPKNPESFTNLCRTKTYTVFPQMALDVKSGEIRYIVNIKNHYEQSVVYETCVEEKCNCFGENLPEGMMTRCVQKYSAVRLRTVMPNNELDYGHFKIPSMCICSYMELSGVI